MMSTQITIVVWIVEQNPVSILPYCPINLDGRRLFEFTIRLSLPGNLLDKVAEVTPCCGIMHLPSGHHKATHHRELPAFVPMQRQAIGAASTSCGDGGKHRAGGSYRLIFL